MERYFFLIVGCWSVAECQTYACIFELTGIGGVTFFSYHVGSMLESWGVCSLYVEDKMSDGVLKNSWLERVRAGSTVDASNGVGAQTSTPAFTVKSRDGWDPWQVWLRHIDQPRRDTTGRHQKSPP
jgi:hypothetical protein